MANDPLIDAFPLDVETPESILARLQADINAGIDPTDAVYADVVPGSVWDDMNRAATLEFDRLYDRMMTEVPAAALPLTAIGVWLDAWASLANLQRKIATQAEGSVRFTGDASAGIPNQTSVAAAAPLPGADPIVFQTTEAAMIPATGVDYVDVPVIAVLAGSAGNVPANSITLLESEVSGVTVSNPQPTTSGSDIETDEALQVRVDNALNAATGAGKIDYYTNIILNYPGVYFVTVFPNTPGLGEVSAVGADIDNNPLASSIVSGLQAELDPGAEPGDGFGLATIGAAVTVSTPTLLDVTVDATISYEAGYSLDGSGGTIALEQPMTAAIQKYVNDKPAGSTVVLNKLLAAIIDQPGVENVSGLTINGAATNLTVPSSEVATVTTINFS